MAKAKSGGQPKHLRRAFPVCSHNRNDNENRESFRQRVICVSAHVHLKDKKTYNLKVPFCRVMAQMRLL